jgi:hypothetical protein
MDVLSFLVVTAALTVEPLRLLITVPAGLIAARQGTPQARWTVIFLGGAVGAAAFAVISTELLGARNFPWAQTLAAGMIQSWVVALLARLRSNRSSAA